ncbi:radical SAM protein [Humidisolicoccus flavus]|uniref:radical SAM protein n=1 Tax=Humidisolicoccus flavus TaxID=3111414 RepID=UPI003251EE64
MRWSQQAITERDSNALDGLEQTAPLIGALQSPEFASATFLEVATKSALNRVPGDDGVMAGAWTINPYRGCQHACVYCFARNTHTYLDLDAGNDFDSKIIVKTNIAQVLEHELRTGKHAVRHVNLGTNTDPYQRAEGKYELMPPILRALASHGVGISVLTKGTLLRRDIPLLQQLAREVPVSVSLSIAVFDSELQRSVEPGTPSTAARLATVIALRDAGIPCAVFVMPVMPGLTDSASQLMEAASQIKQAGASSALYSALHLRPGAKEWFAAWLHREHPELVPLYAKIYGKQSIASRAYKSALRERALGAFAAHDLLPGSTSTPGQHARALHVNTRRGANNIGTRSEARLF